MHNSCVTAVLIQSCALAVLLPFTVLLIQRVGPQVQGQDTAEHVLVKLPVKEKKKEKSRHTELLASAGEMKRKTWGETQQEGEVTHAGVNSQQGVGLGEELLLQRDDDDLHVPHRLLPEETGHLESTRVRWAIECTEIAVHAHAFSTQLL